MAMLEQTLEGIHPTERSSVLAVAHEWVVTVDHKRLGLMYMGAAPFISGAPLPAAGPGAR